MRRFLRRSIGVLLVLLAVALLAGKAWLDWDGPYLEALPAYPFCAEARLALDQNRVLDAIELAEAGGCQEELGAAQAAWNSLAAVFARCVDGVWTGRGEDAAGITCAIASDLIVFGDVRDLTRQGVAWFRGEEADEVLVALSAAGIALTFTPQVGTGTSLLKAARRAGALTERFAKSIVKLVKERAWKPLAGLFGDAGRISIKVGPARATKALAYADDATELAAVARFVEVAPHPLLGLKWGGKSAARIADPALYAEALKRGPSGLRLAATRGSKALLARQPLVVFATKSIYKNPEAVAAAVAWLVTFILTWLTWPWVGALAGVLLVVGLGYYLSGRRRPSRPQVKYASHQS